MAHHSDTTLSEPPLSPFSTRSLLSDGTQTSDEPADLGAFTSVFRVLNQLQLQQQQSIDLATQPRSDSRATISNSDSEYEVGDVSTVWSQHPIASYLNRDDSNESIHSHSTSNTPEAVSEDEEEDADTSGTEGQLEDDTEIDGMSPSLGYLDSALGFLAAEKAKHAAAQVDGRNAGNSSTGESTWRHVFETKRKRRRKRKGSSALARMLEQDEDLMRTTTVVPTPEESSSSPDLPSVLEKDSRSESYPADAPPTPAKRRRSRSRHSSSQTQTRTQSQQRLYIPSSAPIAIPHSLPTPPDARLVRLRALANRLRQDFPQNSSHLSQILVEDFPEKDVIDPRGPEPQPGDTLTHVFIDHSNILIGFLNHAKRSRRTPPGKLLMSFAALTLILERGRPIHRRVLATSSPLYQNMDIAEDLGYSVHVYVRVPDFSGEGANGSSNNTNANNIPLGGAMTSARGLKARKPPVVQTNSMPARPSTESDPGQLPSPSPTNTRSSARLYSHSRSISATTASTSPSSTSTLVSAVNANGTPTGRIRYREQGVDELLQLKLHQALVSPDADPPPAGATIVLATGDGASGQFNEDGFVGVVRTALNKGWMVELYAWGGGLSGAWRKVADEEGRGRLRIWEMDPYVSDLLEVSGGVS